MSSRVLSYGTRAPALLAGAVCAVAPDQITNIFEPLSTPADSVYRAALLALAVCAAIFLTVVVLLIYAIGRFRRRPGDQENDKKLYGPYHANFLESHIERRLDRARWARREAD